MKIVALLGLLWSASSLAHDVSLVTQHIAIRKQHQSGWQQDLLARAVVSRKFDVGLQGTYLERFKRYENRIGAFVIYHPTHALTLEARYLKGDSDNDILPENEYNLSAYYSVAEGLTPYLIYRDVDYSATRLHNAQLGLEIEKIKNILLIPQISMGKATFSAPAETKNVYSYGLRVMYYQEKNYSVFVYGYQGQEASQGIIGRSNTLIKTLTGGLGGGYFLTPNLRAELLADHTDYRDINNQFVTTTLNLRWIF